MLLSLNGLSDRDAWSRASIEIPPYDVMQVSEKAIENPRWVHFGIGNIFRVFIGGIADKLLRIGELDRGLTCVEAFDYEIVDSIYMEHDNLCLNVILHSDGTQRRRVIGSLAEAIKSNSSDSMSWNRMKEVFSRRSLQLASFTITEKGYLTEGNDGRILPQIDSDIQAGPDNPSSTMAMVTALLLERYRSGAAPIALVSMDNCSQNGSRLRRAVLYIAGKWRDLGFVDDLFIDYLTSKVSFPWTMIDKITPQPSREIADMLSSLGIEGMDPIITSKRTFIAPFVNAEESQYLVIEDDFPNGRPPLEKAGVFMTDRATVNKAERMKVTACLNPIHTALGPYGCLLGYRLFADEMQDPDMLVLARTIGYKEGLEVTPDPKIISPKSFLDECIDVRFPNRYLGDTCDRLCVDASQGVGVRFGFTVRSFMERNGSAENLRGIPLAIAGWLRYLLGVDDEGRKIDLAWDPMSEDIRVALKDVSIGDLSSVDGKLRPILSNENIFYVDYYKAGLGETIENLFKSEILGPGAVRATVKRWLKENE